MNQELINEYLIKVTGKRRREIASLIVGKPSLHFRGIADELGTTYGTVGAVSPIIYEQMQVCSKGELQEGYIRFLEERIVTSD